ncbi:MULTISPECIES: hypothetical protein [unclassified Bacillus (in: firmicutes)]|uniref:hypothetical protein n=1 Tax=unclassified Bacillus (in: firmicutes) TaxID=185979 RepID=UPI0008EB3DC3|nr:MULTISPECIES: hypothetical protein [unclassified Bacillus (in: firmicutes)]SFB02028.1 hypothetical protein SAMN02799634_10447 [Bacillus sp. UNCCL13]SFQ89180.1 hypothetical protein SAMN04488577_3465 [Bacillus sp. cl95]
MNKRTKGALAMVLAGAVTFSVTNSLLVDLSPKRLTKEIASTISGDPKKGDIISKAEKAVKNQTPTTNVKEDHSELTQDITSLQVAVKRENNSDIKASNLDTKKLSSSTTTNPTSTNETTSTIRTTSTKAPTTTTASVPKATKPTGSTATTVATTIRATSSKAPTTTTAPVPTANKPTNSSTSTTNRGQETSQTAKEKAASHREQKENNGKKL